MLNSFSKWLHKSIRFWITIILPIIPIITFAQLTADFSATPVSGCAPLVVQFKDLSAGNPTSWKWDFGGGNTSILQNPSKIFSLPGVYSVTLTISNGSASTTITKTNYIQVFDKPTANFTTAKDTACMGQPIVFTDASTSPGGVAFTKWSWDFGDGNTATVTTKTVSNTYNLSGKFPVSMVVMDINGCTGISKKDIVVIDAPKASFISSNTFSCLPPLTVNFTNTSTSVGAINYLWEFGDGSTSTSFSPTHIYTTNGTFDVTLIVSNQKGCIDSIVKSKEVIIQSISASMIATPTTVCVGESISFTNTTQKATASRWKFGDGASSTIFNTSHTYASSGTYTITLISSANTCSDSTRAIVVVNPIPHADFLADTASACSVPFAVNFKNTTTSGGTYSWNFGDGSTSTLTDPVHSYTAAGTYTVSLIAYNTTGTCSDTIIKKKYITIIRPVANFSHAVDSGCVPHTVNFLSTSTTTIDQIKNYIWDFGDGNTVVAATPLTLHSYTTTGIFSVKLTIRTKNGCEDTLTCRSCIRVGVKPTANFTMSDDTVCYGVPVAFTDQSTNATGWKWIFGDGGTSLLKNPTHVYTDTGTFKPFLIAFNNGCPDTSAIKKIVVLPPRARFTYQLSCTDYYKVRFFDDSKGADSLVWNFGDGTTDINNTSNPTHTYSTRGKYNVLLTAYNYKTKCSNISAATFIIAEPIATFTTSSTSGCYPFTVNFISTSQDANTHHWNFGDLATLKDTAIISNPSYTYAATGSNTVTLTITDINGCKNSTTKILKTLGPLPDFKASAITGCTPFTVTFTDNSISDSALVSWSWNFGDGGTAIINTSSVAHTFTISGSYSVTMTVKDKNGCEKTIVKANYIKPSRPVPAFSVDTFSCKGNILTFDASASQAVDAVYNWNFGDGIINTTTNPTIAHFYSVDGYYTVKLKVTDANGCDSTISKFIRILKPIAKFTDKIISVGCGTLLDSMIDLSIGYVNKWEWDFGDGGISIQKNPVHLYTKPGYYNIRLIVTNLGGCKDTVKIDSVASVPGPIGSFTFTPTSGCTPRKVCFTVNSKNSSTFIWDFGDGTVVHASKGDTCHIYTTQGNFTPMLIIGNILPNGSQCLDTASNLTGSFNTINVVQSAIIGSSTIHLKKDSMATVMTVVSGGLAPYIYSWIPSTGIDCGTCKDITVTGVDKDVKYISSVYDANGCGTTDTLYVISDPCIDNTSIPNIFTPNGDKENDLFIIRGVCPTENFLLNIYDRWGVLLFSTNLPDHGWDGRTNTGLEAKNGTYYYVLKANQDSYKGFLELIR